MRIALALALAAIAAGCGQTGSLYLPDDTVETPVEIRTGAPAPAPEAEPEKKEKKDDKPAVPPGR
jgi:predicted small lipoprotein YifL